jgi:hypothetical protein
MRLPFIAAVLALAAAPAVAQLMGARELTTTAPVKGAPGAKPVADIYYLVGEVGAKETYMLTVKGPASLTLFGPDGSEILTSEGSGTVRLEAVLPFTDVFTIAVARKLPGQPYSLSRKATTPTFQEAQMAAGVGYASKDGKSFQCWLVPGVKLRSVSPVETVEFTLGADRRTLSFYAKGAKTGQTSAGEVNVSFEGNDVHHVITPHEGKARVSNYPMGVTYSPDEVRPKGYRCQD